MQVRYVRKWSEELTSDEVDRVQRLCMEVNPALGEDHIRTNHLGMRRSYFQLALDEDDELLGVHACVFDHISWKGRKFPVFFASLGHSRTCRSGVGPVF